MCVYVYVQLLFIAQQMWITVYWDLYQGAALRV